MTWGHRPVQLAGPFGGWMRGDVVESLGAEVEEYFAAGPVGLHEFLWILRSDHPEVGESAFIPYGTAALDHLLSNASVKLVWPKWNDADHQCAATRDEVTEASLG